MNMACGCKLVPIERGELAGESYLVPCESHERPSLVSFNWTEPKALHDALVKLGSTDQEPVEQ